MNQFPFNSEELKTSPKMAAIKVGFIKKKNTNLLLLAFINYK